MNFLPSAGEERGQGGPCPQVQVRPATSGREQSLFGTPSPRTRGSGPRCELEAIKNKMNA